MNKSDQVANNQQIDTGFIKHLLQQYKIGVNQHTSTALLVNKTISVAYTTNDLFIDCLKNTTMGTNFTLTNLLSHFNQSNLRYKIEKLTKKAWNEWKMSNAEFDNTNLFLLFSAPFSTNKTALICIVCYRPIGFKRDRSFDSQEIECSLFLLDHYCGLAEYCRTGTYNRTSGKITSFFPIFSCQHRDLNDINTMALSLLHDGKSICQISSKLNLSKSKLYNELNEYVLEIGLENNHQLANFFKVLGII